MLRSKILISDILEMISRIEKSTRKVGIKNMEGAY